MRNKKITLFIFATCNFIVLCHSAEERSILDNFVGLLRGLRLSRARYNKLENQNPRNFRTLANRDKLQRILPEEAPFPCESKTSFRSPDIPNSVHKLRPGDIDVIGAIGDSLTAGFGLTATNILGINVENRGKSFSIGGDGSWKRFLTIPNILKEFNPKLIGYSMGNTYSIERGSQFNVAEGGAISKNMPYMTKVLITRITKDKRIDIKRDWKMITFMIGDNDFCSEICFSNNVEDTLNKHKEDLLTVLRLLRDNLPRTIVNIIPPPHLKVIAEMTNKPDLCFLTHSVSCPCLVGVQHKKNKNLYYDIMRKWQLLDIEISNYAEFDLDDFTVVPHKYTLNYTFPRTPDGNMDLSFLSEDCFHLSQKGNAKFANDLWNSIMEPFGNKRTDGSDLFSTFNCPSKNHPYIFTRRNS